MYVCVYIYLFLIDQFPSWYIRVNLIVSFLCLALTPKSVDFSGIAALFNPCGVLKGFA